MAGPPRGDGGWFGWLRFGRWRRRKPVAAAPVEKPRIDVDGLLARYQADAGSELHDFATEDLFFLANRDPQLRRNLAFRMPSKPKFTDQAQVLLARLVKQCGMDEEKVEAFMTCAKELILNAHRHGHAFDETKVIIVRYREDDDRVTLIVEDQGPGFDHAAALAKARKHSPVELARIRIEEGGYGGVGFGMVVRMADAISYNEAGNVATCMVMKKAG